MASVVPMLALSATAGCDIYSVGNMFQDSYKPIGENVVARFVSGGGHGSPFFSGYEWVSCDTGMSISVKSGGILTIVSDTGNNSSVTTVQTTNELTVRDFVQSLDSKASEQMSPATRANAKLQGFSSSFGAEREDSEASTACRRAYGIGGNGWAGKFSHICNEDTDLKSLSGIEASLCLDRLQSTVGTGATQ